YLNGKGACPSLLHHVVKSVLGPLLICKVCSLTVAITQILTPFLLQQITLFAQGESAWSNNGYILAFAMFAIQIVGVFAQTLENLQTRRVVQLTKSILTDAIYRKSFNLSKKAKVDFSNGMILNLINDDIDALTGLFLPLDNIITIPLIICISFWFISDSNGGSSSLPVLAIAGIPVFLIFGLLQQLMSRFYGSSQVKLDTRLSQLRQVLFGIKVVKIDSLEEYFFGKLNDTRNEQLQSVAKYSKATCTLLVFEQFTTVLFNAIMLVSFGSTGGASADIVFPSLLFFNIAIMTFAKLNMVIQGISVGTRSYKRIAKFLYAEETETVTVSTKDSGNAIEIENACWKWENDQFALKDISVNIPKGGMVAIIGGVGSGKSTFISSLLGETVLESGECRISGSIAYCSQEPWILSGTIEKNIVLQNPYSKERLDTVISLCCLDKDLNTFTNGSRTEIGENGVNLSGGQKQRLAIARALYSNSDILLFDNPLAALDPKVAKQVLQSIVQTKGTRIVVTHQLEYLDHFDKILEFEDGKLAERNIHDVQQISYEKTVQENNTLEEESKNFVEDEEKQVGHVQSTVYSSILKALGSNFKLSLLVLSFLLLIAVRISEQVWISIWVGNGSTNSSSYIPVYLGLCGTDIVLAVLFISIMGWSTFIISKAFHNNALTGILSAPLTFHETNPAGRIINRMSSDVQYLDFGLNWTVIQVVTAIVETVTICVVVCLSSFYISILIVGLVVMFYVIFSYFQASNLELKRLNSIKKSPLVSHISETLSGISTIKALGAESYFVDKEQTLLDQSQAALYIYTCLAYWLNFRASILSSMVTLVVALVATQSLHFTPLFAAQVALALSKSAELSANISTLLQVLGQAEAELNAFERLDHYSSKIPKEDVTVKQNDPKDWPAIGEILIERLSISYDKPIIKDLTINIKPGEKIGIVGRTGSGKSTLVAAFFRLMKTEGTIKIDGIDISNIGLKTLRSSIHMISQTPILFQGTIRENLLLDKAFTDKKIWDVLQKTGLFDHVSNLELKLDHQLDFNGDNLSLGQKQLLVLSRYLLSEPKLLIMDEATSSVDLETHLKIQDIVNSLDCTVLSIVHREGKFDKVLVLDQGELVEFDTQENLQKRDSLYRQLYQPGSK
ncbi:Multidrug resistance-associated protein 1, partial [Boothiomyces macroporosus]